MSKLLKISLIVFGVMVIVSVAGGWFSANDAEQQDPEHNDHYELQSVETENRSDPYPVGDSSMYIDQTPEKGVWNNEEAE